MAATKTTKKHQAVDLNPIEALLNTGGDVVKGVKDSLIKDLMQQSVKDSWDILLKGEAKHESKGFSHEEQDIFDSKAEKTVHAEAAIDYTSEILHAEKRIRNNEKRELNQQIEEIRVELIKISKSSKQLENQFKDVTVQELPRDIGKYHLNFFEWVLSVLRNARIRVEQAGAWSKTVNSKAAKKGFWANVKKSGTTYQLSSERAVAQQVG